MRINIHAGHNPDGKIACGAVGLIKESTEARAVAGRLITLLRRWGHTVYDCTVNDGTSVNDVLNKIVAKCNSNDVDLDISIHFNSAAGDLTGDGATTGTEAFIYDDEDGGSVSYIYASRITAAIAGLGFKNRGVKVNRDLYVLRATKAPAVLVECCFADDKDDCDLYDAGKMAEAVAGALTDGKYTEAGGGEMVYNYVDENMPEWAKISVKKLIDKGYLMGNEKGELGLNDTLLKIIVINDRAGLYGE